MYINEIATLFSKNLKRTRAFSFICEHCCVGIDCLIVRQYYWELKSKKINQSVLDYMNIHQCSCSRIVVIR